MADMLAGTGHEVAAVSRRGGPSGGPVESIRADRSDASAAAWTSSSAGTAVSEGHQSLSSSSLPFRVISALKVFSEICCERNRVDPSHNTT